MGHEAPVQPWVPADARELPPVLPGYEHIDRFLDAHGQPVARIKPGELYISREDEWMLTSVGSCMTVCLRDEDGQIGGMNHVVLPGYASGAHSERFKYAGAAVPGLIQGLYLWLKRRVPLEARVYGGAAAAGGQSGRRNIDAVMTCLEEAGLTVREHELGGSISRRVMFHPRSGQVMLRTQSLEQRHHE